MLRDISSILLGGMLLLLFMFIGLNYFIHSYIGNSFYTFTSDVAFKMGNTDTELTDSIATICNVEESKMLKVNCVYDYFSRFFSYEHNDRLKLLNETFEGDCDDSSLFYCSVFKKMNISCTPIATDNHMFVVVDFEDYNNPILCRIDMNDIDCW